jgi:hypothetical protein
VKRSCRTRYLHTVALESGPKECLAARNSIRISTAGKSQNGGRSRKRLNNPDARVIRTGHGRISEPAGHNERNKPYAILSLLGYHWRLGCDANTDCVSGACNAFLCHIISPQVGVKCA